MFYWLVVNFHSVSLVFCTRSRPTNKRDRQQKHNKQTAEFHDQSHFITGLPLLTGCEIQGLSRTFSRKFKDLLYQ